MPSHYNMPGRKGGSLFKKLMSKSKRKEEEKKHKGTKKKKLKGTQDFVRLPK